MFMGGGGGGGGGERKRRAVEVISGWTEKVGKLTKEGISMF